MGLKYKFSLFFSVLIIGVILSVSTAFFYYQKRMLLNQIMEKQNETVITLAQIAREALILEDDILLMNYMDVLQKLNESVVYAVYITENGKIRSNKNYSLLDPYIGLQQKAVFTRQNGVQRASLTNGGENIILLSVPVLRQNVNAGWVYVAFSGYKLAKEVIEGQRNLRNKIIKISMLLLTAGVFLAVIFSLRITRHIKNLINSVKRVGEGNLEEKVEVKSNDELKILGDEFNKMAANLKRIDQLQQDFVSSISHELKSPLAAIEGYVDVIENTGNGAHQNKDGKISIDKQELDRSIATIQRNAKRLRSFIDNILDFAKIQAAALKLSKTYFDGTLFLAELRDSFLPLSNKNGINLILEINRLNSEIFADEERLRQALANLVINAIKYTPAGGKVVISAVEMAGYFEFSVADTGIGIPEDDIPYVFDKFRQVKQNTARVSGGKGVGLGLTIAKAIVTEHGGSIEVKSRIQQGTEFIIKIPNIEEKRDL